MKVKKMPQNIVKYKIFIASPSDVLDERQAIEEVIDELNRTYGVQNGLVIELMKWETHSAPGISEISPQAIINEDIGTDYDLFIGILWKKFGTPTTKAKSGTEEEFLNAYNKYGGDSKSIQILFYFKIASPASLSEINPDEFAKVLNFKESLKKKNLLISEFKEIKDFQTQLRIHIPIRINSLRESITLKESAAVELSHTQIDQGVDNIEELGLLDYNDIIQECFQTSSEALVSMSTSMEWVGAKISERTAEIERINNAKKVIGLKDIRDIYNRVAEIMIDFANRLDPEIPIWTNNFVRGIDSFSQLINIGGIELGMIQDSDVQSLKSMIDVFSGVEEQMQQFHDIVSQLPRMSKELNKARRVVEDKLKTIIENLKMNYAIAQEVYVKLHNDNMASLA